MNDFELMRIEPDKLGGIWKKIHPMMKSVYKHSGGALDAPTTFDLLVSGEWVLWTVYSEKTDEIIAILCVSIEIYDTGIKSLYFHFMTGRDRKKWIDFIDEIEDWGASLGCSKVEMMCQKSYAKHFPDYVMTHIFLEKDL